MADTSSPWLTVPEAALRAKVSRRCIYNEIRAKRLRAARIGSKREIRLLAEWVDLWLIESATPVPVLARTA